jgi:hypothetical protein
VERWNRTWENEAIGKEENEQKEKGRTGQRMSEGKKKCK